MSSHNPWTRRHIKVRPPKVYEGLTSLIGHTPLIRLNHVTRHLPKEVEVWAKLEFMNPSGSIKDRVAYALIKDAQASGALDGNKILLDATSGNMGVAYAMIGATLGVPVQLVMPQDVSEQRKRMAKVFGAECVYSPAGEGVDGAIRLVHQMLDADEEGKFFFANQHDNPLNPETHEQTTAAEIWTQTQGHITHFVAAMGSSGTIMGTGRGLKAFNSGVHVVGVQPSDASHRFEGLKHMASSIVPSIYDELQLDELRFVDSMDGVHMASCLAQEEGIAAGNSAGANVHEALCVAATLKQGVVVTVVCDYADRYMEE